MNYLVHMAKMASGPPQHEQSRRAPAPTAEPTGLLRPPYNGEETGRFLVLRISAGGTNAEMAAWA